jgi:hypothetical protein
MIVEAGIYLSILEKAAARLVKEESVTSKNSELRARFGLWLPRGYFLTYFPPSFHHEIDIFSLA